jgi:hypothetical protein
MENPFLIQKYPDLPGSKPVASAVEKTRRAGQKIHDNPERVGAYMERLEKLTENERGFGKLKALVLDRFTVDAADQETLNKIAEGLYESEKRIAIEQGRGKDIERLEASEDVLRRYRPLIAEKAEIQKKTLSSWLDYLQENDAKHPMAFRYYVVRGLEKMGMLDKEKAAYSKRTSTTIAPFPELNSEALGWVYKRLSEGIDPEDAEDSEKKKNIEALIKTKDFAKLYAFAQIETAGRLNRESIEGAWKKYKQGSNFHLLEKDLKGKGTGWCTAEGSAASQLQAGDFYVYYSKAPNGAYTEPRVAIRMEGDGVAEVRGVNPKQELEPELVDTAQKKYHDLPGGKPYDKKARDMKEVTKLVQAQEKGRPFSKEDLRFLYELDAPIEGFGYERDPRIDELRSTRNERKDLTVIFECTEEELQEKEHATLRDVPTFSRLPAARALKKDFKFDQIWESEYRDGRSVKEFALTEKDLQDAGFSDQKKRKELLQKESEPVATVFGIGDVIAKKKRENPNHPNSLTTKEVFEAIDEAGYRPAALQELLAYARDHWKPDADPKILTDEQKLLQRVNSPLVYAFGSSFSYSGGHRCVPFLYWHDDKRGLRAFDLEGGWGDVCRFLVLRKVSF